MCLSVILASCSSYSIPSTPTPISVESEIKQILQDDSCKLPCFLGIVPGKTAVDEMKSMLTRYGEPLEHSPCGYYIANGAYGDELIPYIHFCISNDKIYSMQVTIYPSNFAWQLYSPANVIKRFGTPSKILFHIQPNSNESGKGWYSLIYSYDDLNSVIAYSFPDVVLGEVITVCPNKDEYISFLRLGRKPEHAQRVVPLEKATSFTLETYREYILGSDACFDLKGKAFGNF